MSAASTTTLPTSSYRFDSTITQALPVYGGYVSPPVPTISQNRGVSSLDQRRTSNVKCTDPPVPAQTYNVSEDGELSEGEFEDLYEPKASTGALQASSKQQDRTVPANVDPTGSADDADGSSIYDTGSTQEEIVIDSTSASQPAIDDDDGYEPGEYEPEYHHKEKSWSYSPQLSSKEADKVGSTASAQPEARPLSPHSFASNEAVIGHGLAAEHNSVATVPASDPSQTTTAIRYKSVSEAKKKAQEAILGLWPLKIRYQNYLDEGLDPEVVKTLFTELGLDASVPKPNLQETTEALPSTQKEIQQPSQPLSNPVSQAPSLLPNLPKRPSEKVANGNPEGVETKKSAQEERKDKIARMLAEKKKNAAHPAIPAVQAKAVAPAASTASEAPDTAKTNLRAQNNQKILEKLAALKKQQGQKPSSAPQVVVAPTLQSQDKQAAVTDSQAAEPVDATPSVIGEPDAAFVPGGHLGLSVSSSPRSTTKPRNTKRPIASDFDGYSSSGSALKRTRTQETLIIDVSDDEDVEMDLGSPTDPSSTAAHNALPRQNSLASFPPLSGSRGWRGQKSVPATPAAGTPSEHGHKLDFLTQQIYEAKRKIAEAEAKKVALKRLSGVSTPNEQSPGTTPGALESIKLPRRSDVSPELKKERRDRIASYHLPVLDAALTEKQEKLQRLQEEAAQLAMEVQATIEERQKLTGEMNSLDTSRSETPEHDNQAPETGNLTISLNITGNSIAADSMEARSDATLNHIRHPILLQSNDTIPVHEQPAHDGQAVEPPQYSDMDLDSNSTTSRGGSNTDVVTGSRVASRCTTPSHLPPIDVHVRSPEASTTVAIVPEHPDVNGEDITISPPAFAADFPREDPADQAPADADIPMQMSDAEDDSSYEPGLPQMSGISPARVPDGEDGEGQLAPSVTTALSTQQQILDIESYEPNPAQVSDKALHGATDPAPGEVQHRSSQESQLLTNEQSGPAGNLSVKDLLSYQSPLRYFHAYKFHPKFLETVSGGLKSMTYSTKIDASRPICPSLIDGGQCPNGSACEFQHFDNMVQPGKCLYR